MLASIISSKKMCIRDRAEGFCSMVDFMPPSSFMRSLRPVSYTHLDVYKRQAKVRIIKVTDMTPEAIITKPTF